MGSNHSNEHEDLWISCKIFLDCKRERGVFVSDIVLSASDNELPIRHVRIKMTDGFEWNWLLSSENINRLVVKWTDVSREGNSKKAEEENN